MLRIFINPGHDMDINPGACGNGLREVDIVADIGQRLKKTMETIGYPCTILQSDNLNGETAGKPNVCATANESDYDIFVSLHCNSAENTEAKGTETLVYSLGNSNSCILAKCIQDQLINSIGTVDRGIKERPDLCVLRETAMPAVLVEIAFISNEHDAFILANRKQAISDAVARGITDYELILKTYF